MTISNSMRDFLVTSFACAKCGSTLKLSYELPKQANGHVKGAPTGAAMVHKVIAVEPCETCMKPAEDLRAAVQAILK